MLIRNDVEIRILEEQQKSLFALIEGLLRAAVTVTLHQYPVEDSSEIPNDVLDDLAKQIARVKDSIDYIACVDQYKQGGEA